MSKSIFDVVGQAPDDPILGLNEAFKSDPRDKKVNLSIGVYSTEDGKVPLLRVVAEAEKRILEAGEPHTYLPISGIPAFTSGVQKLILGADSPIIKKSVPLPFNLSAEPALLKSVQISLQLSSKIRKLLSAHRLGRTTLRFLNRPVSRSASIHTMTKKTTASTSLPCLRASRV